MTCDEALNALLEAEPTALESGRATPLGRHLAGCARCRRAVELIERGSSELDGWLEGAHRSASPLDVQAILERAEREGPLLETLPGARPPSGGEERPQPAPRSGARRRAAVRWGLPLAAAAALATLLLVRDPGAPPPAATTGSAGQQAAPVGLALDVPADRNAAVFHTDNPDITVVWIYGGES